MLVQIQQYKKLIDIAELGLKRHFAKMLNIKKYFARSNRVIYFTK